MGAQYKQPRRCAGCGDWSDGGGYCSRCQAEARDPNMTASQALGHMAELFTGHQHYVGVTSAGRACVGYVYQGKAAQWEGDNFACAVAEARLFAGRVIS